MPEKYFKPFYFGPSRRRTATFSISQVGTKVQGAPDTPEFSIYTTGAGKPISSWHDIPYGRHPSPGRSLGDGIFFLVKDRLLRTGPDLEFSPFSPVPEKSSN